MLRHDIAPAHSPVISQAVEATQRWSSALACALASFTTEEVFLDRVSGALLFGPQPDLAPLAFTYVVFAAARTDTLRRFETERRVAVAQPYRDVLACANGVRSRAIQLFGIPSPTHAATGLLDDWLFQPLQLESAQQSWRLSYRPLHDEFMIGSLFRSATENGGLFCCNGRYLECSNESLIYYDTLDDVVTTALERWERSAA